MLRKVNMIKSLFKIFETDKNSSKQLSLGQKTLMLYVTGGIKTGLLQSLVSNSEHGLPTERRDRGSLI